MYISGLSCSVGCGSLSGSSIHPYTWGGVVPVSGYYTVCCLLDSRPVQPESPADFIVSDVHAVRLAPGFTGLVFGVRSFPAVDVDFSVSSVIDGDSWVIDLGSGIRCVVRYTVLKSGPVEVEGSIDVSLQGDLTSLAYGRLFDLYLYTAFSRVDLGVWWDSSGVIGRMVIGESFIVAETSKG